jgi:hypothetical protein
MDDTIAAALKFIETTDLFLGCRTNFFNIAETLYFGLENV